MTKTSTPSWLENVQQLDVEPGASVSQAMAALSSTLESVEDAQWPGFEPGEVAGVVIEMKDGKRHYGFFKSTGHALSDNLLVQSFAPVTKSLQFVQASFILDLHPEQVLLLRPNLQG